METKERHPLIKKAMKFANTAHAQSQMYDEYAYGHHLELVYQTLLKFGFTEDNDLDLLVSAFTHDCLEDSATSYSDLKKEFNENVAEIVYCMTDELGRNRKEKKEKTYPKIKSNPKSIILKLADRIVNTEFSYTQKNVGMFNMYKKEFPQFKWELFFEKQTEAKDMWDYLEVLVKRELTLKTTRDENGKLLIPEGYRRLLIGEFTDGTEFVPWDGEWVKHGTIGLKIGYDEYNSPPEYLFIIRKI